MRVEVKNFEEAKEYFSIKFSFLKTGAGFQDNEITEA